MISIIDLGSHTLKSTTPHPNSPIVHYPNFTSHPASQPLTILTSLEAKEKVTNTSQLIFTSPMERGYPVNVKLQMDILGWVSKRQRSKLKVEKIAKGGSGSASGSASGSGSGSGSGELGWGIVCPPLV